MNKFLFGAIKFPRGGECEGTLPPFDATAMRAESFNVSSPPLTTGVNVSPVYLRQRSRRRKNPSLPNSGPDWHAYFSELSLRFARSGGNRVARWTILLARELAFNLTPCSVRKKFPRELTDSRRAVHIAGESGAAAGVTGRFAHGREHDRSKETEIIARS